MEEHKTEMLNANAKSIDRSVALSRDNISR